MTRKLIQTKKTTLAYGINDSATTMRLTNLLKLDGSSILASDIGDVLNGTYDPGTSREEIFSIAGANVTVNDDGTVDITNIVRGLKEVSPYNTGGFRADHPAGAVVVFGNNPQVYDQFGQKADPNTWEELQTFEVLPESNGGFATDDIQLITYAQALSMLTGGGSINRVVVAGNAGEDLVAGDSVYLDSADSEWKKTDGNTASTVNNVIKGIAQGAGSNGVAITSGVLLFGLDSNQSGMTPGPQYFSDTAGELSDTPGTVEVSAGQAISATQIIFFPAFNQQLTKDQQEALAGTEGNPSDTNRFVTDEDTSGTGLIPRLSALPYAGFGDGSDGTVVISAGTTTLTRDMYYQNLTIQTGGIVATNGFRVFVRGTLTIQGTGKFQCNGGAGGAGGNGTVSASAGAGGTAGAVANGAGSLPVVLGGATGGAGSAGASGSAATNGTAGTAQAKSIGTAGTNGGNGSTGGTAVAGSGPGAGGTGGTGGSLSGTVFNKLNSITSGYYLIDNQPTIVTLTGSASSGGGGGGGGARSGNGADAGAGGGGGGSGAPGGIIFISANTIVTVDGNTYAEAKGGNGGNGGNGGSSTGNNGGGASGGGGGAGGSGGVIIIFYYAKTGTGVVSVTGGTAGTGGALGTAHGTGTNGTAGANGSNGGAGQSYVIAV